MTCYSEPKLQEGLSIIYFHTVEDEQLDCVTPSESIMRVQPIGDLATRML